MQERRSSIANALELRLSCSYQYMPAIDMPEKPTEFNIITDWIALILTLYCLNTPAHDTWFCKYIYVYKKICMHVTNIFLIEFKIGNILFLKPYLCVRTLLMTFFFLLSLDTSVYGFKN